MLSLTPGWPQTADPFRLSAEQMREFLSTGMLLIDTDLPQTLHESVKPKLDQLAVMPKHRPNRVCNNLVAHIPELGDVMRNAQLVGAVKSILGDDYMCVGHRALQPNFPDRGYNAAAVWHRDDYYSFYNPTCRYMKVRDHLPWSILVFYTPVDIVDDDFGPTHYYPGSQYLDDVPADTALPHRSYALRAWQKLLRALPTDLLPMSTRRELGNININRKVPAFFKRGQIAIFHHDLWHAGTPNITFLPRNIVKFEFTRVSLPDGKGWQYEATDWAMPKAQHKLCAEQDSIYRSIWSAMSGWSIPQDRPKSDLAQARKAMLEGSLSESGKLDLCYRLARDPSNANIAHLFSLLEEIPSVAGQPELAGMTGHDREKRYPSYALCVSAPDDSEFAHREAVRRLSHSNATVRGFTARVLGNWRIDASFAGKSIEALLPLLRDSDAWVRGQAAVSLGRIGKNDARAVAGLMTMFQDEEKYVRQYSSEALVGVKEFTQHQVDILSRAQRDELRDVRYFALEALMRSGSSYARETAIRHLRDAYFCEKSFWTTPY